jgi:hypothetical protein
LSWPGSALKAAFVPAEKVLAVGALVRHAVQAVDAARDTSAWPESENKTKINILAI